MHRVCCCFSLLEDKDCVGGDCSDEQEPFEFDF